MTSPRDDHFYGSIGKLRRSPPGGESQSSGFFQTGQGGRTVLPPLSSAFPTSRSPVPNIYSNPYLQPRTPQGRNDHNPALYTQWSNTAPAQQHTSAYYEHHDTRYPAPQAYPTYSRNSPALPDPHNPRKLPPLSVHAPIRDDRWQPTAYSSMQNHLTGYNDIRSPTATYPTEYIAYQQQSPYSYPPVPERGHLMHQPQQMQLPLHSPVERSPHSRVEAHAISPYARSQTSMSGAPYQEPISVLSGEEQTIKKKRKRADAAQLKVLNETYNRTAFPSTEERAELARKLDMSARSVQIWFQNKRQSMRQTSRQSSSSVTSGPHQAFSIPPQPDDVPHTSAGGYSGTSAHMGSTTVPGQSYQWRSSQNVRSLTPGPSRRRSEEEDPRKWPRS